VNNPITDAIQGLVNNAGGLLTGRNPLFAPQITNLFGFNLPGVPLISVRDYFLAQMETWLTSLPVRTQWIVLIDRFPKALNTNLIQGLERTEGDKRNFNIDQALTLLKSYPFQRVIGCLFAQGVKFPTEGVDFEHVSVPNSRGFLPGLVAGPRIKYSSPLIIEFLETNTSFSDLVIRPWTILAGHLGFQSRKGDINGRRDSLNIKTDITIMQFTRTYQNISMVPRKVWTFYNCVPITVNSEELTYDNDETSIYDTSWAFTNYAIQDNLYFPLANIISRIENGQIPVISPFQQGGQGSINPLGIL